MFSHVLDCDASFSVRQGKFAQIQRFAGFFLLRRVALYAGKKYASTLYMVSVGAIP
jgi:hypothetical protein